MAQIRSGDLGTHLGWTPSSNDLGRAPGHLRAGLQSGAQKVPGFLGNALDLAEIIRNGADLRTGFKSGAQMAWGVPQVICARSPPICPGRSV